MEEIIVQLRYTILEALKLNIDCGRQFIVHHGMSSFWSTQRDLADALIYFCETREEGEIFFSRYLRAFEVTQVSCPIFWTVHV